MDITNDQLIMVLLDDKIQSCSHHIRPVIHELLEELRRLSSTKGTRRRTGRQIILQHHWAINKRVLWITLYIQQIFSDFSQNCAYFCWKIKVFFIFRWWTRIPILLTLDFKTFLGHQILPIRNISIKNPLYNYSFIWHF